MINRSDVFSIGHFYKTHGVNGELAFSYTSDEFERRESPYWVLDMEGILVPFFPTSLRMRASSSALVCLDGFSSEEKARLLVGKEVFYPIAFQAESDEVDEDDWNRFLGFEVIDESVGSLGELVGVEDSTLNVLLIVSDGSKETLIPVAGDFITGIDEEEALMVVSLSDDLLNLQA